MVSLWFAAPPPLEVSARDRVTKDREAKKPLVAHVVVALADNASQGIVPIPERLGDGGDPGNNLYWGARYGVRSFLPKSAGWSKVQFAAGHPEHVLERIVLKKELAPDTELFIVADAWRGSNIGDAIKAFTRMSSGHDAELVFAKEADRTIELPAGGSAHVVAYLGHNGLMELTVGDAPPPPAGRAAQSAIVLACISRSYFEPYMKKSSTHFLLATRGLMAPEAYTLDAALTAWFRGRSGIEVHREAAAAYCRYQKCTVRAGESLFVTDH